MSMIAPQPASEVAKLIDEVNHILETADFSELVLKRFKKKAENIKKNDLAMGFVLLGMIANLENNIEEMRSYFLRAIQQSCGNSLHTLNYAISLKYFGLYEEAYEYAVKSYEKDPSFIKAIDILIETTCILNRKDEFEKYASAWYKLTRDAHVLQDYPLFFPVKPKEYKVFLKRYSDRSILPSGHICPVDILTACGPEIAQIFGTPISVALEIMSDPDSNHEAELVAFIQWFGDMEEGMKRYDMFEEWYIENDYDLKTDLVVFSIELVGD